MKKGDIVIIAVILLAAAAMLLPRFQKKSNLIAVIVQDGEITHEIDLSAVTDSYELSISGGRLLIAGGQISYIEAECPDKTCISMGILDKPGDMAACVPGKTCVYIKGSDVDAVTY